MPRSAQKLPALRGRRLILKIGTPIILLILWWIGSTTQQNPFFPPLPEILIRFRELWMWEHFFSDVIPSLTNLFVGFVLAVIIGLALGLLFGLVPFLSDLLSPLINFYRAVPTVAVIPVFISLLGYGNDARLLVIVLAAFPPTWLATMDGIRAVDPQLLDMSHVFGIRKLERLFFIFLPAALPQIFTGLQASLQFSFIVMIATEMLGSSTGIGAMTILAQQSFVSVDMWAGIMLLGVIGFLSNYILKLIRGRFLRWYDKFKAVQLAA